MICVDSSFVLCLMVIFRLLFAIFKKCGKQKLCLENYVKILKYKSKLKAKQIMKTLS